MPLSLNIYKYIRENKSDIVRNYLLRQSFKSDFEYEIEELKDKPVEDVPGRWKRKELNNFAGNHYISTSKYDSNQDVYDKLINYLKNNTYSTESLQQFFNDQVTTIELQDVNKKMTKNAEVNVIFNKILSIFNEHYSNSYNIDILLCYINNGNLSEYEDIFNRVSNFVTQGISQGKIDKIVLDIGIKSRLYDYYEFNTHISEIKDKILTRNMIFTESGDWFMTIYDNVFYYIQENSDKTLLRIDSTNSTIEYTTFIKFIQDDFSPIKNSFYDSKNLPSINISNDPVNKRKSLMNLKYLEEDNNKPFQYNADDEDKKLLLFQINDIFQFLTYHQDKKGKPPASGNYLREPFFKQVLTFPILDLPDNVPSTDRDKYSELWIKIKDSLRNIFKKIKSEYPLQNKDKKYFLFDVEGGGQKHFDYALYSFTEEESHQPQSKMFVKENLWKKLEFKSSKNSTSIETLPGYLTKNNNTLFETVNNTFAKMLQSDTRLEIITKLNEQKDYIQKAIENVLKTQDKLFIIWNGGKNKGVYLDTFTQEELQIKNLTFNILFSDIIKKIIIKVETNKKGSCHFIIGTMTKSGLNFNFTFSRQCKGFKYALMGDILDEDSSDKFFDNITQKFKIESKCFDNQKGKFLIILDSDKDSEIEQFIKDNKENIKGDIRVIVSRGSSGKIMNYYINELKMNCVKVEEEEDNDLVNMEEQEE
jgi:hypothetical protein